MKKQAQLITPAFEEKLWENNVQLHSTVLFLLGINLGLRAGDEHYDLHHNSEAKPSQISFRCNSKNVKCLVYQEDTTTKANDRGLKHMRNEHKIVWVYPSSDITRCPMRLTEKYISLCLPVGPKTKKMNFYLRSLERPTVNRWYREQVLGINSIRKVIGELLKNVKLDGYFTNHSLRWSGTTRLFQEGVDRKLIKEYTGHHLDAVDAYAITSEQQREELSKIIQLENRNKLVKGSSAERKVVDQPQTSYEVSVKD